MKNEKEDATPRLSITGPGFTAGLLASSALVAVGALAENALGKRYPLLQLNACKISLCLATIGAGTFALNDLLKPSTAEQQKNAANSYYVRTHS